MSWVITGSEKTPVDKLGIQNVSLLLHGNGTNGSTTITDSSPSPKTVTRFGDVQISTAQSKFGGASIAFDGNGDYLTTPRVAGIDLLSSDFTIEFWAYPTSLSSNGAFLITDGANTSENSYALWRTGSTLQYFLSSNGTTWDIASAVTIGTLLSGTWQHIALTRQGSTFRGFLDGVKGTDTTSTLGLSSSFASLGIGSQPDGGNNANQYAGYIDDLRITKGIARYTANFTPPTAAFPDI